MQAIEQYVDSHPRITYRNLTRGVRLITEGGEVVGVETQAMIGGARRNIRARKVIMATGGFQAAKGANLQAHMPDLYAGFSAVLQYKQTQGSVATDGDGIDMLVAIGANRHPYAWVGPAGTQFHPLLAAQTVAFSNPINPGLARAFHMTTFSGPQPRLESRNFMIVNRYGDRIGPEDITGAQGAVFAPTISMQGTNTVHSHLMMLDNRPPFYLIINNQPLDTGRVAGADPEGAMSVDNLRLALQTAAGITTGPVANEVVTAPTIAGLVAAVSSPFTNFEAQVADYNYFVENNLDTQHGKAAARLNRSFIDGEDGPFFAVRIYPSSTTSFGGVRINDYMQVLQGNTDIPIPNVYAVGETSWRHYFGWNEQFRIMSASGIPLTFAAAMGHIAGIHAAEALAYMD
jgi:hypothetical protein